MSKSVFALLVAALALPAVAQAEVNDMYPPQGSSREAYVSAKAIELPPTACPDIAVATYAKIRDEVLAATADYFKPVYDRNHATIEKLLASLPKDNHIYLKETFKQAIAVIGTRPTDFVADNDAVYHDQWFSVALTRYLEDTHQYVSKVGNKTVMIEPRYAYYDDVIERELHAVRTANGIAASEFVKIHDSFNLHARVRICTTSDVDLGVDIAVTGGTAYLPGTAVVCSVYDFQTRSWKDEPASNDYAGGGLFERLFFKSPTQEYSTRFDQFFAALPLGNCSK